MVLRIMSVLTAVVLISTSSWAGMIKGSVAYRGDLKAQAAVHLMDAAGNGAPPGTPAVIIQKRQKFIPRVLPVIKGTTVQFPNRDTVVHEAYSLSPPKLFHFKRYGPAENPEVLFDVPGKVDIFCDMHPKMAASVLVFEHPYFTLTSEKGTYEIKDVPPGTYRIKAWAQPFVAHELTVEVGLSDVITVNIDIPRVKPMTSEKRKRYLSLK